MGQDGPSCGTYVPSFDRLQKVLRAYTRYRPRWAYDNKVSFFFAFRITYSRTTCSQKADMEIYTSMIEKFPELVYVVEEMPERQLIETCAKVSVCCRLTDSLRSLFLFISYLAQQRTRESSRRRLR